MKMSWLYYKGWLLFDENCLLLGCNYLSDYLPGMFLSKHLEALARWKRTWGFRSCATLRLNIHCLLVANCFFAKLTQAGSCFKLWRQMSNSKQYTLQMPLFHVQSYVFGPACTLTSGTLFCSDLGIQKFSNFYVLAEFNITFVKVGAIGRSVAVWYLQRGSECTEKWLLCITVIAHRGTLSRHYIKPFDGVTLSGPF